MDNVKRVPAKSIREIFNAGQFSSLIQRGELKPVFLRNDHLNSPQAWQGPFCTHSQIIRYLETSGQWVVEMHQYLRPDQTLGASGKPDPKRLRVGDTIYVVE